MELYVIFWITIGAVISIIPAYFIKKYNITKKYIWLFLSMLCYLILMFAYSKLFVNNHNIVSIYQIIKILSMILSAFFGLMVLGNEINLKKTVGIMLSIISIYLLS